MDGNTLHIKFKLVLLRSRLDMYALTYENKKFGRVSSKIRLFCDTRHIIHVLMYAFFIQTHSSGSSNRLACFGISMDLTSKPL